MCIGIVPSSDPLNGGLRQYALKILEALVMISQRRPEDEYVAFARPRDGQFPMT